MRSDVQLFVSTPLWLVLRPADGGAPLLELPTWRPSDTWFGPSTRHGVLAYASRTRAHLESAAVLQSPVRAITRVTVLNHAPDLLRVERLNLPVPQLALFEDDRGRLWTDSVRVERLDDGTIADAVIEAGAPSAAPSPVRVAEPRMSPRSGGINRAFGALLG